MTTKHKDKKKIMIIVWKWRDLTHINEMVPGKEKLDLYKHKVEEGKNDFYKVYPVEQSAFCSDAIVVAAAIYKANEDTQMLLNALIDKYAQEDSEVMLFLHRSNFYDETDVDRLLEHFGARIAKCFLFADGRDYIYYKTQKSGILDDIGSFHDGRDPNTDEKIKIFDGTHVKQPYFDRVWQYYEIEYETKVFQFKEELFDQWLPFMLPTQPNDISKEALLEALRQGNDRALFFRLKSFIGMYQRSRQPSEEGDQDWDYEQKSALGQEEKAIAALEKKDKQSYVFDDCIRNLEHQKSQEKTFVAGAYEEAKEAFLEILFAPEKTYVSKTNLRNIADKMDYLIKVIPGELD